jgi:hypothetical protein
MNNSKYPHLTSPIQLGKVTFRNRIFSAPMGATDITADCCPGPRTQGFYELRAKGGAAAVTVSELVVHPEYTGQKITADGVICKDKDGQEVLVPGKTVICALGQRANRADVDALRSCAPFVREVGDCVRPANITKAIYEAYHAALDI